MTREEYRQVVTAAVMKLCQGNSWFKGVNVCSLHAHYPDVQTGINEVWQDTVNWSDPALLEYKDLS